MAEETSQQNQGRTRGVLGQNSGRTQEKHLLAQGWVEREGGGAFGGENK